MKAEGARHRLSRDRKEPLYQQLYQQLRSHILSGELAVGNCIPPESQLMREYGVSRITVRAALDHLVRDGLIHRQRGRGSFVSAAVAETRSCLSSFTDQMLALGRTPSTELLRLETLTDAEREDADLPFEVGQEVLVIERLRSVDGEKAGLVRTFLPRPAVRGLMAEHFSRTGRRQSLLYVLEHTCGIMLDKGEETVEPLALPSDVAERLGCLPGTAAIKKICLLADTLGNSLLYEVAYWAVSQTQLVQRYPSQQQARPGDGTGQS